MPRVLVALLVLSLGALACGDPPPPPNIAPRPKSVSAAVDAGSLTESKITYVYNPVGKRDPFRTPIEEAGTTKGEGGGSREKLCTDPLCQYDLDSLTLVAVVTGDANPVAMVEDAQHTGFIVRRNTRIGKQGGKVTQILRDCIQVTEFFQTPDGKSNPNRVDICVKKETGRIEALDLLNNRNFE